MEQNVCCMWLPIRQVFGVTPNPSEEFALAIEKENVNWDELESKLESRKVVLNREGAG